MFYSINKLSPYMLITRKKYVFSCLRTKKDLAPKNGRVGGGGGRGAGQRPLPPLS